MDGAAADALAANLFLQPAVVRALVHWWLLHLKSLPRLVVPSAGAAAAGQPGPADLFAVLVQALATRPVDLTLRGQSAVLPTADAREPRALYIWDFLSAAPPRPGQVVLPEHAYAHEATSFAVSDEYLNRCGFRDLLETMHVLVTAPERFWAHIGSGGLRGHVVAAHYRFAGALADAYRPLAFIVHACSLLLDLLTEELDVAAAMVQGPALVRAWGHLLQTLTLPPTLVLSEGPVLQHLARALLACQDVAVTRAAVEEMRTAIDAAMLQAYGEWRRTSAWPHQRDGLAVPPEDVPALMALPAQ